MRPIYYVGVELLIFLELNIFLDQLQVKKIAQIESVVGTNKHINSIKFLYMGFVGWRV